jgi:predicted aspartyl protease
VRVLRSVRVKFMSREATAIALFDSGSSVTIIQRRFFEKVFGSTWSILEKSLRVCLVDGRCIDIDKYAQLVIEINGFSFPETVLVVDEFVEEIEIEEKKVKLPELIIGAGTMDKYGIALDPKEGIKIAGATLLI